jgi:5-methyltetrahydrofolate--homocysteine methyltransferase
MAVLRPLLTERKDAGSQGTVVMGTVKGDLHDIGKNLVGMMAEGAGFTIVDLGTDTSAEEFVRAVTDNDAAILGMSALLTTTMIYMKTVVDTVRGKGLDVKIAVGGAPVTPQFCNDIGADGERRRALQEARGRP